MKSLNQPEYGTACADVKTGSFAILNHGLAELSAPNDTENQHIWASGSDHSPSMMWLHVLLGSFDTSQTADLY